MERKSKEYCTPVVWGAVAFMFIGAGVMYYYYVTGVTVSFQISPSYSLGMMFLFLFVAAIGGTSFRLTETDITFRVFGIPLQKKSWSQVCRIVYFHPRHKNEALYGIYSSCLIFYKDFREYPQEGKSWLDEIYYMMFLFFHPITARCIHIPYKATEEFLAAIKDLSRLPVEEILPGVEATESRNIQPPPVSGESGLREPRKEKNMEKQPKQHKLLICFLFGFTALNGLCFGLSPTQTDTTIRLTLIGAAVVMLLGVVLYPLMLPRQVDDCGLAIRGFLVFAGFSAVYLYLAFSWWLLAIVAVELVVLVPLTIQLLRKNK